MEVPVEIKEEIRKSQESLRRALKQHQMWVGRLKEQREDDSSNDAETIRSQIRQTEQNILAIGHTQKRVIERLRNELSLYQDNMKARNICINSELDYRNIALQLRLYQEQHRTRKKSISLLKPSVLSELNIKYEGNDGKTTFYDKEDDDLDYEQNNGCSYAKNKDVYDDTDFIEATENFSLKDAPSKNLDHNATHLEITNALKKIKTSISLATPQHPKKRSPSPRSIYSRTSSPSPPRTEASPTPSPPLTLPLPQPGDIITQEMFMRSLGLITHRQRQLLEKKRDERKRRQPISTNKNEFVYGNFDMGQKRKKPNFPYLQQNIGPPQTRAQKMRRQQMQSKRIQNMSPDCSPSISPPIPWPLPSGLTIQAVPSPGPKACTVCRQTDSVTQLNHCQKCKSYFHTSCSSSPSSRSPSSRSRSPINISDRHCHRQSTLICPECGDEIKETKLNNWMVISRGFSNNAENLVREKLMEKRILLDKNKQLNLECRKLEIKADTLKENIESSNIEKKQLISNQNNMKKRIKTLLDFVNKFKDPSDLVRVIPIGDIELSRSTVVPNENKNVSSGY